MSSDKIKVLIVDDSSIIRKVLETIFNKEKTIEIVGFAKDGAEAIEQTKKLRPDLITMDIMMPTMDGYEATKHIMNECPTPIIVLSSLVSDEETDAVFKALASGALAAVPKFFDEAEDEYKIRERELVTSVRALSEVKVIQRRHSFSENKETEAEKKSAIKLIAFGVSTGGPEALAQLVPSIGANFPVPIVGVLHISRGFLEGFVNWLQKLTQLKVSIPSHGDVLLPGHLYFAPDGYHLKVKEGKDGPLAVLDDAEPVKQFKPSISILFESVAKAYPGGGLGGILTGMGRDGASGLLEMKRAGCYTFIQTPATCVVPGMPEAAKKIGAVQKELLLEEMVQFFNINIR